MDILHLVDRLEELFNESRPIWFTHSVAVDEDRLLDIIDQMRVVIPDEVKKAQQLLAQRDRIMAQAQEEANRIVQLAREKAEQMVDRETTVKNAQNRANQILAQAREDAALTRFATRNTKSGLSIVTRTSGFVSTTAAAVSRIRRMRWR